MLPVASCTAAAAAAAANPVVCRYSSAKLAGADLYTAGAAIVWLKQLGPWSDADIADRLIPCYPEVRCGVGRQLGVLRLTESINHVECRAALSLLQ
jgi:hypothetical protein